MTPRDWKLHHIDAPQRMWSCKPVPFTARLAGVPRDSLAFGYRFRWGDPLQPGPSGLYVHSIRTPLPCQPPGDVRYWRVLPRRGFWHASLSPDRTLGSTLHLPISMKLATLASVVRPSCPSSDGNTIRSAKDGRAVLPRRSFQATGARSAGSGFPVPDFPEVRNRNRGSCVLPHGWAPSGRIIWEQGRRAWCQRSPGGSGIGRAPFWGRGLFVGRTGDGVGRLGPGETFANRTWFGSDAFAGWR